MKMLTGKPASRIGCIIGWTQCKGTLKGHYESSYLGFEDGDRRASISVQGLLSPLSLHSHTFLQPHPSSAAALELTTQKKVI